ncbi:MAG: hypothetical protein OEM41_10140, partial [Ignavibacteria bacterium]|nr:hypothetical protein [Ignavibacteria bacterium]
MRITKIVFVVFTILVFSCISVHSGDFSSPQNPSLKGRSSLELNFGAWLGSTVSNAVTTGGVQAEVKAGSFVGGVQFTHWMQEYL